jgi:murein DD-endopeptidase MepM/ murein hydrolase activator NlpD
MRRLAAAVSLALVLASGARADVFRIVPNAPAGSGTLPSAVVPNAPGSISFSRTKPRYAESLTYPQLLALWQRAGASYGIPWPVLAAINKVESNFGRNMGPSSAGAIGWMQFMPSTWERWGVDANGDGVADPWNAEDAVTAAARYLAATGGQTDIASAVFSYNHAQWYVDEVLQTAQLFRSGGVDATFSLDRLQVSLSHARAAVVRANHRLVSAQRHARRLLLRERGLRQRAAGARVLSDQLALERLATQVGVRQASAQSRVADLRAGLQQAQQELDAAHDRSLAASFMPAAGTMLAAPSYDGSYVFPVGGGPSVVSVSHHHHDYPAADIDAPMGSPVYALADAVVLRAWQYPDGRCGIGLTIRSADGQTWTYCHLSYLDPSVTADVALSAGAQVGLVGQTGHATGPHLHLQLDPTVSYPQDQPWFERFAGVAFRWQDGGANDGETQAAVFAVVPTHPVVPSGPVVLFTR